MTAQASTVHDTARAPAVPVFFDKTGRRWRRLLTGLALALLGLVALIAGLARYAAAPLWRVPAHAASSCPKQLADQGSRGTVAIIGDEENDALVRVDLVRRVAGRIYLTDPFSGRTLRAATAGEAAQIGARPYVMEWYGHPADHRLVLTFDDGPEPQNTPEILNILSREHVPATFFVIGTNVSRYSALVQREIREGHVVGNHTLTHVGPNQGTLRDRAELIGDDRVIRAGASYGTRLFRMPYGDPDENALTVLEAQQLGYTVIDYDTDTNDWQYKPGQAVTLPRLDGRGHVVLMHDGGGNHAATVELLPRLIAEARAAGYTFTTAASLVPRQYVPSHVTPSAADLFTWACLWSVTVLPGKLIGWLFWFGAGSLTIMSLLYVAFALVSRHRQKRHYWADIADSPPLVTMPLSLS